MIDIIKKYLLKISAINFWFKDDDYNSGGSKVYKYFREA